jgi:hypothetical protein
MKKQHVIGSGYNFDFNPVSKKSFLVNGRIQEDVDNAVACPSNKKFSLLLL